MFDAETAAGQFLEEAQGYVQGQVSPLLSKLLRDVLREKPEDPLLFLLDSCTTELSLREQVTRSGSATYGSIRNITERLQDIDNTFNVFAKGEGDGNTETGGSDITSSDVDEDSEDEVHELPAFDKLRMARPRHSVSAEVYGEFNKRRLFEPVVHFKTEETRGNIRNVLSSVFLFSILQGKSLETVIDAIQENSVPENTRIIRQGDDGDALYVIVEGSCNCLKISNFNPSLALEEQMHSEQIVKVCRVGDVFGELALLYNTPRAASVVTTSQVLLWQLDRETFSNIVKDAAFQQREMYETFLAKVPLLKDLQPYDRLRIADALKTVSFKDQNIVTQGERGDTFWLIEEGNCVATRRFDDGADPVQVMDYGAGDYFGELAIIRDAPRAATVAAVGFVRAACLNRNAFKRLLGQVQDTMEQNAVRYVQTAADAAAVQ